MDPELEKGLAVIGAVFGTKEIIGKLLGPTADYMGAGLKTWTEKRVENTKRIFEKAAHILGDNIDNEGSIPPKVLKEILDEGSYSDDEFAGQYFGGVLASSRTIVSRDDRGAAFAAMVSRLSTYQLRSHYFFYSLQKRIFDGNTINIGLVNEQKTLGIFIPSISYVKAMDFSKDEDSNLILPHVINGLIREGLLNNEFQYGSTDHLRKVNAKIPSEGIVFYPSPIGFELYLWAHGKGSVPYTDFLKSGLVLESSVPMTLVGNPLSLGSLK